MNRTRKTNSATKCQNVDELAKVMLDAQYVIVGTGPVPREKPDWFDESKFRAGQEFIKKYFGSIFFAHLIGLMTMLFSPRALKPLIFTGKSETPRKAYQRYISTTVHIMSWYRGDVWNPENAAHASLVQVRKYHSDLASVANSPDTKHLVDKADITHCGRKLDKGNPMLQFIRKDLDRLPYCPVQGFDQSYQQFTAQPSNPRVSYINQLDMSMTQFAFMGLIILHPHKLGLARATREELEGFIHMWRCFGYLLGIEDCFNFCQFDNLPQVRCWSAYVLNNWILPCFKTSVSEEYEHMSRAVALGARGYMRKCSFERLFLYVAWTVELPVPSVKEQVCVYERCRFYFSIFLFSILGNLPYGNKVINFLVDLAVRLIVRPPPLWPKRYRPPYIPGLYQLWNPA